MEIRNHKLVKTILFAILLLNSTFAFAQNKILIKIDGEEYERDYPKTLEESIQVIDALVDLEVTADTKVVELEKSCKEEIQKYEKEIAELKEKIESIKKESETAKEDIVVVDKTVTDYVKTNTRFTTGVIIGPVFGAGDNTFGSHVELLADYRILRNFHIGGSLFFSTFNNTQRNFEIGCGILLGYSIY